MEPFESLRVPYGPFFVRADVRRASRRLSGRSEEFHGRLVSVHKRLRELGLEAYASFVISDEINVLINGIFGRRVEKIVSVYASAVTAISGEIVDARIVYAPSAYAAAIYLRKRQELGSRNAVLKQAFEEALRRSGDRRLAAEEIRGKPLDELRREYARMVPKRALYGTICLESCEVARPFGDQKGLAKLVELLRGLRLPRYESLVRSRA